MTRVTMHQPNFLPYSGFYDKVAKSDVFIIVDHLSFSKGKDNWHHRNRIRVNNGTGWDYLTVPVSEHWNWKPFNEARISDVFSFKKRKHIKTIIQHYGRAPYFDFHFDDFLELYSRSEPSLSEFNISLIKLFIEKFRLNVKVLRSTELNPNPGLAKDDMIIDLMKQVSGTTFISGDGAKSYIQPEKFREAGISLEYQDYACPEYLQTYTGFVPNLSAFDMLMNTGRLMPSRIAIPAGIPLKPNGGSK